MVSLEPTSPSRAQDQIANQLITQPATQELRDSNSSLGGSEAADAGNDGRTPPKKLGLVRTAAIRNLKEDGGSPVGSGKNLAENVWAPVAASSVRPTAVDVQPQAPAKLSIGEARAVIEGSAKPLAIDKTGVEARKAAFQNRHPAMNLSNDTGAQSSATR